MISVLLLLAATTTAAPAPVTDLKLPPGFTAKLFADNPIAPDIYTMTIDDTGRVLIAGRGYVRVLVDDDNDGCADRAVDLIDGLKDGPMGLFAEADSLFVVADGGLKRYRGYNGKDKIKGPPETILALKTGGEHDAHAVRRGPDGWLYLLCGNMAGARKQTITGNRSPVRDPIAGALIRIAPDFKTVEVVADGFRNPYSFDFNLDGEPFTYDSDNERCLGLPWYEPCRFYHIVSGGNYGWRSPQRAQMWRAPPYFPDVVAPICYLGRGSPTGIACYRHTHFPESYRGGFFLADWTFGRIYHVPLTANGSTWTGTPEVFAEATGTSGFAPTALVVHPTTGELFVSIGGRGTRGGVYRISFEKGDAKPKPLPMPKRSLDFDKQDAKLWIAGCASDDLRVRRRALELMTRHREMLAWGQPLIAAVKENLVHADRLLRAAAGRAAVALVIPVGDVGKGEAPRRVQLTVALAGARDDPDWALKVALATLDNSQVTADEVLIALRLIHLAYGDLTAKDAIGTVYEGYTMREAMSPKDAAQLHGRLAKLKRETREVKLEVARMYAILGSDFGVDVRSATISMIEMHTPQADDFHYLIALARISDPRELNRIPSLATVLLEIQRKITSQRVVVDRHWPLHFDAMLDKLRQNWPSLGPAVLAHDDFGRPEHVAFIKPLRIPRAEAAYRFLAIAATTPDFTWTPALVDLLDTVPQGLSRPLMERLWKQPELHDAIITVLATNPALGDAEKLLAGLSSFDSEVVRSVAVGLAILNQYEPNELVACVKALRRLAPEEKPVRAAILALLRARTKQTFDADPKEWTDWIARNHPAHRDLLNASDGFDATAWQKRLAGFNWANADPTRGKLAFAKATCAACHDGGRATGPSLVGITKRFSRDDLLTAIVQPSKDIPARYRPTRIVTAEEKTYTGLIVYEAIDGVIMQTGPDATVRIAGKEIVSKKQSDISLMPAGLLDKLTDAEIVDLLAYLASLR